MTSELAPPGWLAGLQLSLLGSQNLVFLPEPFLRCIYCLLLDLEQLHSGLALPRDSSGVTALGGEQSSASGASPPGTR